jgi:tRNA (guanine37-N1)-methyltransferase
MKYRIFTLHPDLFSSFTQNSLIARGIEKNVIEIELVNWREKYGFGNYKQVDDKPFGGGSGMVLMCEPIYQALKEYNAVSPLYEINKSINQGMSERSDLKELNQFFDTLPESSDLKLYGNTHKKVYPNNSQFENIYKKLNTRKATISLTPRGFPINQEIVEWLAKDFDELNILCGRYEGFDSRICETVDLELSLGNFITNGGEIPSMALIESVSRLIPNFITKNTSVIHDSFSSGLNNYIEQSEFIVGKNNKNNVNEINWERKPATKLFNNTWWIENVLPFIEHPQYTRPTIWQGMSVPTILMSGDHKKIHMWRRKWY